MALIEGNNGKRFRTEQGRFRYERKKRLANKDEILHRSPDGTVKLTATYWEIRGSLVRANDKGALAAFEDEVDEYKRLMEKHDSVKNLTTRSVISRMAEGRIEKLLLNSGYTAEALAAEFGLNVEDIMNEDNWGGKDKENTFTVGDRTFTVIFNYMGSILEEIT